MIVPMWKALILGAALALTQDSVSAQNLGGASSSVDLANLSEQVRALSDQTGQLSLRLEQAERQNAELRTRLDAFQQSAVTIGRLNAAVADLNRLIESNTQATREQIATAVRKLGDETNAALDALAKGRGPRPSVTPSLNADDPKGAGTRYTIQPGDSLSIIAKKTGAKKQDIIDVNKLADPSKILVGQTLIIPGGTPPAAAPATTP